jgi:hypothetical protein
MSYVESHFPKPSSKVWVGDTEPIILLHVSKHTLGVGASGGVGSTAQSSN